MFPVSKDIESRDNTATLSVSKSSSQSFNCRKKFKKHEPVHVIPFKKISKKIGAISLSGRKISLSGRKETKLKRNSNTWKLFLMDNRFVITGFFF